MKGIYSFLILCMLAFAGLQYNDPDGLYWATVYLVPAIAMGFAAFAPNRLQTGLGRCLVVASVGMLAAGIWVFWPSQTFARPLSEWMALEPAKETMGLLIALLCNALTIPTAFSSKQSSTPKPLSSRNLSEKVAQLSSEQRDNKQLRGTSQSPSESDRLANTNSKTKKETETETIA